LQALWLAALLVGQGCAWSPLEGEPRAPLRPLAPPSHAKGFEWGQTNDGTTILVLRQPRTQEVLATVSTEPLPEGTASPWPGIAHVTVDPSRGVATTSTTHVHLLHAGAGLNGWKACTSLKYLRDPEVLAWADATSVRDVRGDGGWNVEAVEAVSPGWMAVSPTHALAERSWPLVPLTEYLEPTPLGRAEWMVPMAWMVGDSLAGAQAFAGVQRRYVEALARATQSGKRIFTGSVADGVWHAPGDDSFVAQWIRDAGGVYALASSDAHENVELGLESLLALASESDAWVVVTYDPDTFTVQDLLALDPRHEALLRATKDVWVCNTAHADYFGEVVPHPEWVLEDLTAMMAGEGRGPHGLFERLAVPQSTP
jgi:iron complex transport system substrate-binding protein